MHRDGKHTSGSRGREKGRWRDKLVSFSEDENIVELDGGDGCAILQTVLNLWIPHFKRVSFTVCEIDLNL